MTDKPRTHAEQAVALRERHSERLRALTETTQRLKRHNDKIEEKMRKRGSIPPPKGSQ